jgi:alpha-galactosidase
LSKAKAVGLCHGDLIGLNQISQILGIPADEIETELIGLNHFGVFTKITRRATGEDLYPLLRERERSIDLLAHWDEMALPRIMLRTFGLFPYPGTNHIGEYVAWAEDLMASQRLQYFYDPASNDPWNGGTTPDFVYSLQSNPTQRPLQPKEDAKADSSSRFTFDGKLDKSGEYGIPVAEAIAFDLKQSVGAVNVQNTGFAPNLPLGMVVETGAVLDARGIHPKQAAALPTAYAAMLSTQGAIHQLLIEAYQEKSRNKLLQALLLDPTVSNYHNAVALVNEMCERQKEILPALHW